MTNRFTNYILLGVWESPGYPSSLSISKIFEVCRQNRNTHILIDCSKESQLFDSELWQSPDLWIRSVERTVKHNYVHNNRVDVITGNYKLIPEEPIPDDTTTAAHIALQFQKKENKLKVKNGHPPITLPVRHGPFSYLIKQNFFDTVEPWPTYFLVWNGSKVAKSALTKLTRFPSNVLSNLFFVKVRVAKPHRMLLLDQLCKYDYLMERNLWTLIDPNNEADKILADVGGKHFPKGQPVQDPVLDANGGGNLYEAPPPGYDACLIDVVTETDIASMFITEKTVWPIVYMKPFMIHGARYINHNLQKYGFKLYNELIDYTFDTIESPRERTVALAAELHRLSELELDLNAVYTMLQPTIEHNLKVYLNMCFDDPAMPGLVKKFANDVVQQQLLISPLIDAQCGTWVTYTDRNGGNGEIIDVVRSIPYLRDVMGGQQ